MASIPFDTLRFSERLQAGGFPADQAKALAEALAAYGSGTLVTKTDLDVALAPIRADLGLLKWGIGGLTALTSAVLVKLLAV